MGSNLTELCPCLHSRSWSSKTQSQEFKRAALLTLEALGPAFGTMLTARQVSPHRTSTGRCHLSVRTGQMCIERRFFGDFSSGATEESYSAARPRPGAVTASEKSSKSKSKLKHPTAPPHPAPQPVSADKSHTGKYSPTSRRQCPHHSASGSSSARRKPTSTAHSGSTRTAPHPP